MSSRKTEYAHNFVTKGKELRKIKWIWASVS